MNSFTRILSRRGFLATSVLGGLVAPFLKSQRVEAAPSVELPLHYGVMFIPQKSIALPVGQDAKIGDIDVFTVVNPHSITEIIYQGRVMATGGGRTLFTLKVDGSHIGWGGYFEVPPADLKKSVYTRFSGFDVNQKAGAHTLSLWAYTSTEPGGAAWMNPDDLAGEYVFIKEYYPIGYTYLPTIMK